MQMSTHFPLLRTATIGAAAAATALTMLSCASTMSSSPRQVDASNPTVTYQYRNDDELIQANQRALAFCEPYQTLPRAQHFSDDVEHGKTVVFECVSNMQAAPLRQPDSELRYNYRSDQELLDVSRNAQVQCRNSGNPDMSSNVVVNSDGSRTVTFHCSPRARSAAN
jgi:hypothetical protein